MKFLVPAALALLVAAPALAQDTMPAVPAAGTLPTCGPDVTDKCQQPAAAERVAADEYKGGGKDNSAMMGHGAMRSGAMRSGAMHHGHRPHHRRAM